MISARLFTGVAAVVLLAGCASPTSTPTSPSGAGTPTSPSASSPIPTGDQLAGAWALRSIQPAGQAEQTTPAGTSYTLTFADGRLSTRADCNMCGGTFALAGQLLTAGPNLACTRAACPTMAFESTYTSLLAGDSTVTVSEGSLVLSSARGVLRFTR